MTHHAKYSLLVGCSVLVYLAYLHSADSFISHICQPVFTFFPPYGWQNKSITPSESPSHKAANFGIVNTLGIAPMGYRIDDKVKVFHLTAQPVEQWLTDGIPVHDQLVPAMRAMYGMMSMKVTKKVRAWGYNGTSPGPTIEVTEGDTIRIFLKNELPEPTTIHWHGIELPYSQDGAEGTPLTQPGETGMYEFTLHQSGTYLYHSGFNIAKQDSYGLAGMLIIHPKAYEQKVDKHFAILLQEWALLPGNDNPHLSTMDFNWFTFNGKVAPSIPVMKVTQGERIRISLGNMSMDNHPIHIHGHVWHVVGTEGGPIQKTAQWVGSTVDVAPGSTRTVEFIAWNPGLWRFHCHKIHHVMNAHAEVPLGIMPHGGMFTFLQVEARDIAKPWQHPGASQPDNPNLNALGYPKGATNMNYEK